MIIHKTGIKILFSVVAAAALVSCSKTENLWNSEEESGNINMVRAQILNLYVPQGSTMGLTPKHLQSSMALPPSWTVNDKSGQLQTKNGRIINIIPVDLDSPNDGFAIVYDDVPNQVCEVLSAAASEGFTAISIGAKTVTPSLDTGIFDLSILKAACGAGSGTNGNAGIKIAFIKKL